MSASSEFLRYDSVTLGPKRGKLRPLNVAVLRVPELVSTVKLERWELVARLCNLMAAGYDYATESWVLECWPDNGLDREGRDE